MVNETEVENFLYNPEHIQIIDVRSPIEFEYGHIPNSINIPLFDNNERSLIGTIYKQQGKEKAFIDGLKIAGTKLAGFVNKVKETVEGKDILVYCWRGGMRSKSIAWLFDLSGLKTFYLIGGYKSYRTYARKCFERKADLNVLSGYTGCGKTDILHYLDKNGQQILDIENIAIHKGSVFGNFEQTKQPTNEQFQNNLFEKWNKLDFNKPIWIEDESFKIGNVSLPEPLYNQIINSNIICINLKKDYRIKRLIKEYSQNNEFLINSVTKLERKLGSDLCRKIIDFIRNSDYYNAAEKLIEYYDKTYDYTISKRKNIKIFNLFFENDDIISNTNKIFSLT